MLSFFKHTQKYIFSQSKFKTYKDVILHNNEIQKSFMRSSGPGGQSVNTTNSKAEVRVLIKNCTTIDRTIEANLHKQYPNFVNKQGQLIVTSQAHRSQNQNLEECLAKLQKIIFNCSHVPQQRKYQIPKQTGIMEDRRIQGKKRKSQIKGKRQLNKHFLD